MNQKEFNEVIIRQTETNMMVISACLKALAKAAVSAM